MVPMEAWRRVGVKLHDAAARHLKPLLTEGAPPRLTRLSMEAEELASRLLSRDRQPAPDQVRRQLEHLRAQCFLPELEPLGCAVDTLLAGLPISPPAFG